MTFPNVCSKCQAFFFKLNCLHLSSKHAVAYIKRKINSPLDETFHEKNVKLKESEGNRHFLQIPILFIFTVNSQDCFLYVQIGVFTCSLDECRKFGLCK